MVGALLVETDNAVVEVGAKHGEPEGALTVGLHIPDAGATPVVVVAPAVDLGLTADGDAVDIAAEHLAAVDEQLGVANAVVVVGLLAVVVGPQGEAYPAPGGEGSLNIEL